MSAHLRLFSLTAVLLLGASAHASTYVVDFAGGPGTSFLDLPPAVTAAAPGDILLVRTGAYSGFTLEKRLTIVGLGPVSCGGLIVQNTVIGSRAVVVGIVPATIIVRNCAAPVILQDFGTSTALTVSGCSDVRLARGTLAQSLAGSPGFVCDSSRVEFADSIIHGGDGSQFLPAPFDAGAPGSDLRHGSLVHFARTCSFGGNGTTTCNAPASPGGPGVLSDESSLPICIASSFAIFQGGVGGSDPCASDCSDNQPGGVGLWTLGGALQQGMTFDGPDSQIGPGCSPIAGVDTLSGGGLRTLPVQPVWTMGGTPAPGALVQFTLSGPPGAQAVYKLGRQAVVQTDSLAVTSRLVRATRTIQLGTIPSSGKITLNVTLSPLLTSGGVLMTQAEITMPGTGELRRSNSLPIVLR